MTWPSDSSVTRAIPPQPMAGSSPTRVELPTIDNIPWSFGAGYAVGEWLSARYEAVPRAVEAGRRPGSSR
jgi:hypothetical protein